MNGADSITDTVWCTFRVGAGLYGLDVLRVHEVLRPQPLTRFPLAPPSVAGLLNLRGQVVAAVDLRVLFGQVAPTASTTSPQVVVRGPEGLVSLIVDAIGDVRSHSSAVAVVHGGPGATAERGFCVRTLLLDETLLSILDVDRVLASAFGQPGREPLDRVETATRSHPGAPS